MKKIEVRTYNMGESLFNAILFFILGIILFTNPNGIVKVLIYIIGGISILIGIFKLLMCYKLPETKENQKEIVNGLVYMIIGMVTIVCAIIFFDAVENVLRLTFAVFLLYVGINRFINAFKAPKGNKAVYFVNSLLIVASSVALALINNLPLRMIGLFIIGYSIIEIIGYILCKREDDKRNTIEEAMVIEEKEENEDKKLLK